MYVILEAQLLTTAAVSSISFFNVGFKTWIQTHPWMMYLSFGLSIGFLIATFSKRRSYPMNMAFLSCFTLVEAYTVAVVTSFYDSKIVLEAVVITGALFFVLSLFACQTKYDITAWQGYLFGALCMLMIFGFVGFMFFPGDWVELAYAWGAAFVFSGYIVSCFGFRGGAGGVC